MLESIGWASAAGLVVVWLVYPVMVWGLSRLRPNNRQTESRTNQAVTVVLATRGEPDEVRHRVEDCLAQKGVEALAVVVARDQKGPKWPPSLFADQAAVRVVEGDPAGGKAATLNAGVRAAQSDIIVFTDTHQRFRPGAITALLRSLDDPEVGAVSGRLELPKHTLSLTRLYWGFESWLRASESRVHSAVGVTGAVYAVRTDLWRQLPNGLILDDLFLPMNVVFEGYRVGYSETALAWETRSIEPEQEYRRKVRTLTGVIQLCAWMPTVLLPIANPIFVQFLFHKLLRFFTPFLLLGIFVGALSFLVRVLGGPEILALFTILAFIPWIFRSRSRRAASFWKLIREGTLLQRAIIVAGFNGIRKRWDVWD